MLIACRTAIAYFKACLTIFKMFALLEPAVCNILLECNFVKTFLKMYFPDVFDVDTSTLSVIQ